MKNDTTIGIIGLGYVGLPLAVEFGKVRRVIGFDINRIRIAELNVGKDSTLEVTADDLSTAKFLHFSHDENNLKDCDIFIVTVPTPIDAANRPDLTPLIKASETVGKALRRGAIIIYESTVYPGCTEEVCVPILEKHSGLVFNKDFFCGYSPERINPGDKVNTLTTIKKITSGSTPEVAETVDKLYGSIIKAGTWKASSLKVAEAAKVIENSQRDLNIAFVNELSVIFNRMQIDTIEVLEAAGTKWNFLPFRPGMVGGHCIGVDPYYLTHKAEQLGYNPQVILAGRRINDSMAIQAAQNIIKIMLKNGINAAKSRIGILGITFKDNCPDIRNSKVIDLINELNEWGAVTTVYDPWADPTQVEEEYGIHLSREDSLRNLDAVVIAVAHNEFRTLKINEIKKWCNSDTPVLADLKSIMEKKEAENNGFIVYRF